MEPKIIFEDEELLVLDKPAGMIVNRSDTTKGETTLQEWVEGYLKIRNPKSEVRNKSQIPNSNIQNSFEFRDSSFEFAARAGIVHRLDKETSGIILVAKTLGAFINLQAQFKERKVQKTYLALAHGKVEPETGEINVAVGRLPWNRKRFGVLSGGRESVTRYRVISNIKNQISKIPEDLSLVELCPKTGRTHQIRVHLQYVKHPIFADSLYAGRKTSRDDRKLLPRVFLHASKISFFHPKTNELFSFESPLPEELKTFLNDLKP
ncbi:MAG: Pseudouridine synthase [Candidatus Levybacteria bacterium]|nr:Pseudouridine synthase [Candidatus Levybacteria bacterium]